MSATEPQAPAKPSDHIEAAHLLLSMDGLVHLTRALSLIRAAREGLEGPFTSITDKRYQSVSLTDGIDALTRAETRLNVFARVASCGAADVERIFEARTGAVMQQRARRLGRQLRAFGRALDYLLSAKQNAKDEGL